MIDSFEQMTDMRKIGTNSELSAFEEAIRQNNDLLERLKESRAEVEAECLKIIDAMSIAFNQKHESIEAMRTWRKTIVNEGTMATNTINAMRKNLSADRINDLREFVELIERLNKVDPSIIVGKLFAEK